MKTKIFDALKTKFEGVSETTLNRIAEKAAKTVTEEEQLDAYIDGVTFQNVIDSEADYRATRGTQTAIENYEKKHNIKDGKPIVQNSGKSSDDDDQKPDDKKDDNVPAWAKDILGEFAVLKQERQKEARKRTREQIIDKVIELGANKNDRELIDKVVKLAKVEENDDIDEKANEVVALYNTFKKPVGSGKAPGSGEVDDDETFMELLNKAMEE